jgi:hypothetical protein
MLDNLFGIFNNVPPRFNWVELDLPFPSDDRYFNTASYDELAATRLFPVRKMKIEDAFLILFLPPDASKERLKVLRDGCLTALDMQMLIHCMIYSFSALLNFLCTNKQFSYSPLYPPMDPHLWQPAHLPTNNQYRHPPPPFQNSAVELENHLERN